MANGRIGPQTRHRQRGIFGLILGGITTAIGIGQARDARKAGKRSEQQEQIATGERVRRLDVEKGRLLGAQISGAAASGVSVESKSVLAIQQETVDEIEREKEFVQQAGAFAAESAELRGRHAAFQGLNTALTGAGQIFSIINQRRNTGGGSGR